MYDTVQAVLESLRLEKYMQNFMDNEMDDEATTSYIEENSGGPMEDLKQLIPVMGHRSKFLSAFRKALLRKQSIQDAGHSQVTSPREPAPLRPPYYAEPQPCSSTSNPPTNTPLDPSQQESVTSSLTVETDLHTEGPRPVQIVRFESGGPASSSAPPRVVFNEEEFRGILRTTDSRLPVAVLAVAGQANKGKSLFLNYVLRYLYSIKDGRSDWIDLEGSSKEPIMLGFSCATTGHEVVPSGIWTWSEPITLKVGGEDVNILLMDIQGVFDEHTGRRESSILFGLGLLTSSCLILNTSQGLQEDTLQLFQDFLPFGPLTLSEDGDGGEKMKPFQKLAFVIRDWENPEEFPYGETGGSQFIEKKLEPKESHSDLHRRIRLELLKEYFEEITCFLLPHPDKEMRQCNFKDAFNTPENLREFAHHLQQCIESIAHPDRLHIKTLNGNVLSGEDLLAMLKAYSELFNSDQLPSSDALFNACAQHCNVAVVNRCVNIFVSRIKTALSQHSFLNEMKFGEVKDQAAKEALDIYSQATKMGGNELKAAARLDLEKKLTETSEHFGNINKNLHDEAEKALNCQLDHILASYNKEMERTVSSTTSEGVLIHSYNEAVAMTMESFEQLKPHPALLVDARKSLHDRMDLDVWLRILLESNEKAELELMGLVSQALSKYNELMSPTLFLDEPEFQEAHRIHLIPALKSLSSATRAASELVFRACEEKLRTQLDAAYNRHLSQLRNNIRALEDKLKLSLQDAVNEYESLMENLCGTDDHKTPLTQEELSRHHEQSESIARRSLQDFLTQFRQRFKDPTKVEAENLEEFHKCISNIYTRFEAANENILKHVHNVSTDMTDAKRRFHVEIKRALEVSPNDKEFQAATQNLKSVTIASFRERLIASDSNGVSLDGKAFTESMEKLRSQVEQLLEQGNAVYAAESAFVEVFQEAFRIITFLNENEFSLVENQSRKSAIERFTQQWNIEDDELRSAFVEILGRKLSDRTRDLQQKNKDQFNAAKIKLDQGVETIVRTYRDQMRAYAATKVSDESLLRKHDEASAKAMEEFKKLKPISFLYPAGLTRLLEELSAEPWLKIVQHESEKIRPDVEGIVARLLNEYLQAMDPPAYKDELDFEEAHETKVKLALQSIKSTVRDVPPTFLQTCKDELSKKIQAAHERLLRQLRTHLQSLADEVKSNLETAYRKYTSEMEKRCPAIGKSPVAEDELEDAHLRSQSAAEEVLLEFFEFHGDKFKEPYAVEMENRSVLLQRISDEQNRLVQINKNVKEKMKAEIRRNDLFLRAKEDFQRRGSEIADSVTAVEGESCSELGALKSVVLADFRQELVGINLCEEDVYNTIEKLECHIDEMTRQYVKIICWRIQEDQLAVKTSIQDARKYYQDQMKALWGSKPWFPPEEFKRLNDNALAVAVSTCKDEFDLTNSQLKALEAALKGLYLENEMRNLRNIPSGSYAIGIDLGTSFSRVGVYKHGKFRIIEENGVPTIPSYVSFNDDHRISVGQPAKDNADRAPEDTVFDAKRLVGRKFYDPVVQEDLKLWPFTVKDEDNEPRILCRGKLLRPEVISAKVLARLKQMASEYLGEEVSSAVVTVPAYFNDSQRQATKDAATIAGLDATLLTEPVAAAIAYGLHRTSDVKKNVLIFDLGGGTFDVAILEMMGGKIKVLTINGDTHLGGEDFDSLVLKFVIEESRRNYGVDLTKGKESDDNAVRRAAYQRLQRVRMECERQKRNLSQDSSVQIVVEGLDSGLYNFGITLQREDFENMIHPMVEKCIHLVKKSLTDAKLKKSNIDDIVLVGGPTRIPKVRESLSKFFDDRFVIRHKVDPDRAVVHGAALKAALKNKVQAEDLNCKIHITDAAPLSIGSEDSHGALVVQIPKNSPLPFSHKLVWSNTFDNQKGGFYRLYEGEETLTGKNHFLGKFILTDLPLLPKGECQVEMTTTIDKEGIVTVKAVERVTGTGGQINILTYKGRMSAGEIKERRKEPLEW